MKASRTAVNWIGLGTIVRRELKRFRRSPLQPFLLPWVMALLFIFTFGFVVGSRVPNLAGHSYLEFVLPGILMVSLIHASFMQSASQLFFSRFLRFIEETLVAPLSHAEMIAGTLAAVFLRALVTAAGILLIGAAFGVTSIHNLAGFVFWLTAISMLFGLLGIVVGLWAQSFEQLSGLMVFFISPLSMVGGVFNTVEMLPAKLRWLALGNPLYYFIDGLRDSMIGFGGRSAVIDVSLMSALLLALTAIVWKMYSAGYGLRA